MPIYPYTSNNEIKKLDIAPFDIEKILTVIALYLVTDHYQQKINSRNDKKQNIVREIAILDN